MDTTSNAARNSMTPEGKRRELYKRQAALLATFLEHGTISKAQYDKSLHDLTVKMGYGETNPGLSGSCDSEKGACKSRKG